MAHRPRLTNRPRGSDAVRPSADGSTGSLAARISRLPEHFQPFFDDFRGYVSEQAKEYVSSTKRPKSPREFKIFVAGFLKRIAVPLDLVQRVVIATAYRWPLPSGELSTKALTGAVSGGAAAYGQTVAYGSLFSATAGALTVGVVGEIVELYAIASARTLAYEREGLYPGEEVIAADLEQILGSKHLLAGGTKRHMGDEYLTALLDLVDRAVIDALALPLWGPARGSYRSFRNVGLAFDTPLTNVAADEGHESPPPRTPWPLSFRESLTRLERSELPPGPYWGPA